MFIIHVRMSDKYTPLLLLLMACLLDLAVSHEMHLQGQESGKLIIGQLCYNRIKLCSP